MAKKLEWNVNVGVQIVEKLCFIKNRKKVKAIKNYEKLKLLFFKEEYNIEFDLNARDKDGLTPPQMSCLD